MWVLKSFRTYELRILPKAFIEACKGLEHSLVCCSLSALDESVQCSIQQEILRHFF